MAGKPPTNIQLMINLSLTVGSMLAVAIMQQKCKMIETPDVIRNNRDRKICTEILETVETVETLSPKNLKNLNCLMQFFYTLHT